MSRDFSVHCEYCHSLPLGYYCGCEDTLHSDNGAGVKKARECFYQHIYDETWQFHPCPFFVGEIRFHEDKEGYMYDVNSYARIRVPYKDGKFQPEEIVKE